MFQLLGQATTEVSGGMATFWLLVLFALSVAALMGVWKMFEKAGQPGWAAIIPIYNAYILLKVAGRPGWWLLLLLIPIVNVVATIMVAIDVAKNFGKDAGFGIIMLWLFSGIGYMVLGFGDAKYKAASAKSE